MGLLSYLHEPSKLPNLIPFVAISYAKFGVSSNSNRNKMAISSSSLGFHMFVRVRPTEEPICHELDPCTLARPEEDLTKYIPRLTPSCLCIQCRVDNTEFESGVILAINGQRRTS